MRNEITGVIKLGQLKRIQQVLHENWKDDNRFENINWQEKIDFIKKGKGNLIPVYLTVDFSIENSFAFII